MSGQPCFMDTQRVMAVQVHPVKRVAEHVGAVALRGRAILNAAHGGQIICDSATLEGITGHLNELYMCCVRSLAKSVSTRWARYTCLHLLAGCSGHRMLLIPYPPLQAHSWVQRSAVC